MSRRSFSYWDLNFRLRRAFNVAHAIFAKKSLRILFRNWLQITNVMNYREVASHLSVQAEEEVVLLRVEPTHIRVLAFLHCEVFPLMLVTVPPEVSQPVTVHVPWVGLHGRHFRKCSRLQLTNFCLPFTTLDRSPSWQCLHSIVRHVKVTEASQRTNEADCFNVVPKRQGHAKFLAISFQCGYWNLHTLDLTPLSVLAAVTIGRTNFCAVDLALNLSLFWSLFLT